MSSRVEKNRLVRVVCLFVREHKIVSTSTFENNWRDAHTHTHTLCYRFTGLIKRNMSKSTRLKMYLPEGHCSSLLYPHTLYFDHVQTLSIVAQISSCTKNVQSTLASMRTRLSLAKMKKTLKKTSLLDDQKNIFHAPPRTFLRFFSVKLAVN